jgi:hypothetical protein
MKRHFVFLYFILLAAISGCSPGPDENAYSDDIRPYEENPRYWQYKGKPVLLLGGTCDDNLFQLDKLEAHLDLLHSVGGNYIRNTMSSRDSGNLWPFYLQPDGLYDLDKWNEAYWDKFGSLLELTNERDIIVQIEVWDRFDYSRDPWQVNPFNPSNNVNYTEDECAMAVEYPRHPSGDLQTFFHSIPGMPNYTREHCMDNETSTPPEWGRYWMKFIQDKAGDKQVYTTDMFDRFFRPHQCASCLAALGNPEIYEFLDVSQINSRNFNETHWDTLQWILQQREQHALRPVNCVKVYGGENTSWGSGSNEDGVERFLRDVVGGCAAVRHHRPPTGNGLNERSQASIKSIRLIETMVNMWELETHMELLTDCEDDEAYLTAKKGESYVMLFTDGGSVTLDLDGYPDPCSGRWIDIGSGTWGEQFSLNGKGAAEISAPGSGGWFAVITRK